MSHSHESEAMTSELPPELPPELQCAILSLADRALDCRALSHQMRLHASLQISSLAILSEAAAGCVLAIVGCCARLTSLDLSETRCVDDDLVANVLRARPGLAFIDVSESGSRLTQRTIELFRATPGLRWRAHGCWRMHSPHPSLDALEVVVLQILALRGDEGSGEGIAAAFAHASPANRLHTGPVERFGAMIRGGYACLLSSRTARVACVASDGYGINGNDGSSGSRATFLVSLQTPEDDDESAQLGTWLEAMGMEDHDVPRGHLFQWVLSRQPDQQDHGGCWMTDSVQQLPSFGPFSFMDPSSPVDPDADVSLPYATLDPDWLTHTRVRVV